MLRRCLRECAWALGQTEDPARDEDLFERGLLLTTDGTSSVLRMPVSVRFFSSRLRRSHGATI